MIFSYLKPLIYFKSTELVQSLANQQFFYECFLSRNELEAKVSCQMQKESEAVNQQKKGYGGLFDILFI